jgi:hypothetical protein
MAPPFEGGGMAVLLKRTEIDATLSTPGAVNRAATVTDEGVRKWRDTSESVARCLGREEGEAVVQQQQRAHRVVSH